MRLSVNSTWEEAAGSLSLPERSVSLSGSLVATNMLAARGRCFPFNALLHEEPQHFFKAP